MMAGGVSPAVVSPVVVTLPFPRIITYRPSQAFDAGLQKMEYTEMLSPLVSISGLRNDIQVIPENGAVPLESLPIIDDNLENTPLVRDLINLLTTLSSAPEPWNPRTIKNDRVHYVFQNTIHVPKRSVKPSPLSPKNPNCKAPIFTAEWIKKYSVWLPTVSIVFFALPTEESEIEGVIEYLLTLRDDLARHGTHMLAIAVGSEAELARLLPTIRRQTGLNAKNALFSMADDLSPVELEQFVQLIYRVSLQKSQEFFTNKMLVLREKRKAVAPPLDLLVWDARFTLKLAYCAEFKGDLAGAIKLYESSYDSLAVMFENKAITVESPAYVNAREVLDAVAIKIFQHSLPSRQAYDKLMIHISTVEQAWTTSGIGFDGKAALEWKAVQYAQFAKLCRTVKMAGLALTTLSEHPAGTPTGLIWLDAAKMLSQKPNSEAVEDPYAIDIESCLEHENIGATSIQKEGRNTVQNYTQASFINAISELSGYKRAKAYALTQYGDWLVNSDSSAAVQAFKSARQALKQDVWPEILRYLSKRLDDKFMLFTLGDEKEFSLPMGSDSSSSHRLFRCTGTFESGETYIGREIRAQVTLKPDFPGHLSLESIKINHTLGSVTFENGGSDAISGQSAKHLVRATEEVNRIPGCLEFDHGKPRTYEFPVTSVNTGEIQLKDVEIKGPKGFSQSIDLEENSNVWLIGSGDITPRSKKHLSLLKSPLKSRVHTRPARIEVRDHIPSVAAVDETLKFAFELRSHEDEDITPEISVVVDKRDAQQSQIEVLKLDNGQHKLESNGSFVSIEGQFEVPSSFFELVVILKFNTSTDRLPVLFEHRKEVDVVKPFRVNYDLIPQHLQQQWPAFFAANVELPNISRKWRLSSQILSLFPDSDVILKSSSVRIECDNAAFNVIDPQIELNQLMHHNTSQQVSHSFISSSGDGGAVVPAQRTFEALAFAELVWSRKAEPQIENVFKLPSVRLNLPTQEPRVLVVADKIGNSSRISQVTFHIENATARLLNFSISMSSSTYFAFQGPKAITIRMLPFSTRGLTYQLTPLGDGSVQNKRPLPDMRVYDINYKRALAILPGDENITFHQGSLFL